MLLHFALQTNEELQIVTVSRHYFFFLRIKMSCLSANVFKNYFHIKFAVLFPTLFFVLGAKQKNCEYHSLLDEGIKHSFYVLCDSCLVFTQNSAANYFLIFLLPLST